MCKHIHRTCVAILITDPNFPTTAWKKIRRVRSVVISDIKYPLTAIKSTPLGSKLFGIVVSENVTELSGKPSRPIYANPEEYPLLRAGLVNFLKAKGILRDSAEKFVRVYDHHTVRN